MGNYYEILGISQTANAGEIRAAYKRLAMRYHPDHNHGSVEAEEMFKVVNEAYHTLSNSFKKSRYDTQINHAYFDLQAYQREVNRRKYYRWQHAQQKTYRIDKDYLKIQALAFLVFIVIAGFCFAILHAGQYYTEQQQLQRILATSKALKQVDALFSVGKFDDAFKEIYTLKEKDPLEYRFNYARDSLVSALRYMAEEKFNSQDFSSAVAYYLTLKNHEQPASFETIRKISVCQYYLGNYEESLEAMKQLLNQRPYNLELVYHIGIINLEKLQNKEEALYYFTYGKKVFKENLTEIYGAAFEVVMNPSDAPDIYFDIFQARARTNIELHNFADAVTDCNWAIFLRPNRGEPYKLRAMANSDIQKFETVCMDLSNAKKLGAAEVESLEKKYCR